MNDSQENVRQDDISSHIFSSVPGEFCELVNVSFENVVVFEKHSVSELNS